MFSTKTSDSASSRCNCRRPASSPRASSSERLPRFSVRKLALSPSTNTGPCRRYTSPLPGRSTFTTVAPRSASTCVQYGPATYCVRSITRVLSSGFVIDAAALRPAQRARRPSSTGGGRDTVDRPRTARSARRRRNPPPRAPAAARRAARRRAARRGEVPDRAARGSARAGSPAAWGRRPRAPTPARSGRPRRRSPSSSTRRAHRAAPQAERRPTQRRRRRGRARPRAAAEGSCDGRRTVIAEDVTERRGDLADGRVRAHGVEHGRHRVLVRGRGGAQPGEHALHFAGVAARAHVREPFELPLAHAVRHRQQLDLLLVRACAAEAVDADDDALARLDRLLLAVCSVGDRTLERSVCDSLDDAVRLDLFEQLPRTPLELVRELLEKPRAAERIGGAGDAALVGDDLLRSQREPR